MRTKAELLLLGALEKAPVFSNKEVTKELLSNVAISYAVSGSPAC